MHWMLITASGIILILITIYVAKKRGQLQLTRQRQKGIKKLQALKSLLVHIQQHRGLSNGELNGDASLRDRVLTIAQTIARDWTAIEDIDSELKGDHRFIGIHTHWSRLKLKYATLAISNNLEQHNRLILNLLYLIEDTSESHHLDYISADTKGIEVLWRELLETAETIGQVRALGTGIVASGGSDSVQRIRVKFLNEKIQRMLKEVTHRMQQALDNGSSHALIAPLLSKVSATEASIEELTKLNDKELYKDTGISISSEAYFTLASRCMDPLLSVFDDGIEALKKVI